MTKANDLNPLDGLIRHLASLPGLGPRSARRAALYLLQRREETLNPLIAALDQAAATIKTCAVCGNLDHQDPCRICADQSRDRQVICVVATVADLWAIERTKSFRGTYHALGGVLSALDGISPADLSFGKLTARVTEDKPAEIILALSATVDGQATAHYIAEMLAALPVKITRLAHGVPVGGELDYLDDGTIMTAMKSRAGF